MRVYFTSKTLYVESEASNIKRIITAIESLGHSLTSGKQIVSQLLISHDRSLSPKKIFKREQKRILTSDCMIAEVTEPSSGVGGEIVYALTHNIPVLALFYKESENKLSPMIEGNPSENLFLEHYDDQNCIHILRKFFHQVDVMKKKKGRLIVVDGGDGSGKTVQSKLLVDYFKKEHIPVKYMDFPRYYMSFHGRTVARFLRGEFGTLESVSPYLASLAYALDRASVKDEMDEWLGSGGYIISNRYATSSMAHQAAKLSENERKEYFEWIDELEYKVHGIPREDIVVYLYVPWKIGLHLTAQKGERKYTQGKADITEKDIRHRMESEAMYLELSKKRNHWVQVNCVHDGRIDSKEQIHTNIIEILKKKHIIPCHDRT